MLPVDDHPAVTRSLVALGIVIVAAVALLVGFGAAIVWVIPDRGGTPIHEPDAGAPQFADAVALTTALGCNEPQPFDGGRGLVTGSDARQPQSTATCVNDSGILYVLVYADHDTRRLAEKKGESTANVCSYTPQASGSAQKLGFVRGPNWLVLTPSGRAVADAVGAHIGQGVVNGEVTCPSAS
jgi:hypothetical protein